MLVWIAPPPTDRLWYAFQDQPTMDIVARPEIGGHQLKYMGVANRVSSWVAAKLQVAVTNTLVFPSCGDLKLAFLLPFEPETMLSQLPSSTPIELPLRKAPAETATETTRRTGPTTPSENKATPSAATRSAPAAAKRGAPVEAPKPSWSEANARSRDGTAPAVPPLQLPRPSERLSRLSAPPPGVNPLSRPHDVDTTGGSKSGEGVEGTSPRPYELAGSVLQNLASKGSLSARVEPRRQGSHSGSLSRESSGASLPNLSDEPTPGATLLGRRPSEPSMRRVHSQGVLLDAENGTG
uniref:SMP-LTD domain-containing protein n=1 Tax=Tetraselmis chuii TaxID=63592 RepID=A0A7S1XAY8_9CHLO